MTVRSGPLPAYWIENKGVNSLWHVPIPPQAVGARLHYRSAARQRRARRSIARTRTRWSAPTCPTGPSRPRSWRCGPEGLVGNRRMTVRVDARGSTYDVYFPTVGLHSDVRPSEGDLPQSRSHFRAIVGGLAVGRRLDWFTERLSWESFQHYQGATNLLVTELTWRSGPIRVWTTDFVAMGRLPAPDGRGDRVARPVPQAVPRSRTKGPSRAARCFGRLHPGRGQRRDRRARA